MPDILIADDSSLIRSDLENAFSEHGLTTSSVCSGPEAIEMLSQENSFKLLISDFNMPEMNGLELVQKIRQTLNNQELKVIIISTETNSTMRRQCKDLNISGWALKPISTESILPVVRRLIS